MLGLSDGLKIGFLEGLAVGDLLGVVVLGFVMVGVFVGWLLGEFVVTVTDMVTIIVAAPAVVFKMLNNESSASLKIAVLLVVFASWYSFLRATPKLLSAMSSSIWLSHIIH